MAKITKKKIIKLTPRGYDYLCNGNYLALIVYTCGGAAWSLHTYTSTLQLAKKFIKDMTGFIRTKPPGDIKFNPEDYY